MKLIPFQNTQEIELILNNGLGFDVKVKYDNGFPTFPAIAYFHNVIEIHWRYNHTCSIQHVNLKSKIHAARMTTHISNIEYIDIQAATQLSDSF